MIETRVPTKPVIIGTMCYFEKQYFVRSIIYDSGDRGCDECAIFKATRHGYEDKFPNWKRNCPTLFRCSHYKEQYVRIGTLIDVEDLVELIKRTGGDRCLKLNLMKR